eukprot:TRINITY_DN2299_c0_g2_i1.p1 TRINITY_DN2299_c0_g2~~TRINITY_DN2299_c0_g2_i1.p1  ORF type:complete len:1223 (-),score=342.55 TRINITY_DN2299_c0_g2_i1:17-3685(-)
MAAALLAKLQAKSLPETESLPINTATKEMDDTEVYMSAISKQMKKANKIMKTFVAAGAQLSIGLAQYSSAVSTTRSDSPLGPALEKSSAWEYQLGDLLNTLTYSLDIKVAEGYSKFVDEVLPLSQAAKKRWEAARRDYDAAIIKVQQLQKEKKPNPPKIQQAEQDRERLKQIYLQKGEEAYNALLDSNESADFAGLEKIATYFEAYYQFFKGGYTFLRDLHDNELQKYKKYIQDERSKFEQRRYKRPQGEWIPESISGGATSRTRMFCVSYADIISRDNPPGGVPVFLAHAIAELEKRALDVQGIFRLSPPKPALDALKKQLDAGKDVNFAEIDDVNVISGLIKLFLRELPEPLLTFELYNEFVSVVDVSGDDAARCKAVSKTLAKLPGPNMALLKKLVRLCVQIEAKKDLNKMTATNLAVVLCPSILRMQEANPLTMVEDIEKANKLMVLMISFYKTLFDDPTFVASAGAPASRPPAGNPPPPATNPVPPPATNPVPPPTSNPVPPPATNPVPPPATNPVPPPSNPPPAGPTQTQAPQPPSNSALFGPSSGAPSNAPPTNPVPPPSNPPPTNPVPPPTNPVPPATTAPPAQPTEPAAGSQAPQQRAMPPGAVALPGVGVQRAPSRPLQPPSPMLTGKDPNAPAPAAGQPAAAETTAESPSAAPAPGTSEESSGEEKVERKPSIRGGVALPGIGAVKMPGLGDPKRPMGSPKTPAAQPKASPPGTPPATRPNPTNTSPSNPTPATAPAPAPVASTPTPAPNPAPAAEKPAPVAAAPAVSVAPAPVAATPMFREVTVEFIKSQYREASIPIPRNVHFGSQFHELSDALIHFSGAVLKPGLSAADAAPLKPLLQRLALAIKNTLAFVKDFSTSLPAEITSRLLSGAKGVQDNVLGTAQAYKSLSEGAPDAPAQLVECLKSYIQAQYRLEMRFKESLVYDELGVACDHLTSRLDVLLDSFKTADRATIAIAANNVQHSTFKLTALLRSKILDAQESSLREQLTGTIEASERATAELTEAVKLVLFDVSQDPQLTEAIRAPIASLKQTTSRADALCEPLQAQNNPGVKSWPIYSTILEQLGANIAQQAQIPFPTMAKVVSHMTSLRESLQAMQSNTTSQDVITNAPAWLEAARGVGDQLDNLFVVIEDVQQQIMDDTARVTLDTFCQSVKSCSTLFKMGCIASAVGAPNLEGHECIRPVAPLKDAVFIMFPFLFSLRDVLTPLEGQ